jgi:N-carbamoyl-L-amino-acid hydrolase
VTRAAPAIDGERLWRRVQELSAFTAPHSPWTRRAFSTEFRRARSWLADEFQAAGLQVRIDAAGNLVGRRAGQRSGLPPLATGSHCDTVVGGGRFDGIIGVLAGIEVARALREADCVLDHPLEVIDFLAEEPSDFGVSCVGSRGMCGFLTPDMLASVNAAGETLGEAIAAVGGRPELLGAPLRQPEGVAAFVELHIEQGPMLERMDLPIGVVTNIVGIRRVGIRVTGQPDHAGTTPMHVRRDALVGAALLISEVFRRASHDRHGGPYIVSTVGQISAYPNMSNAVPGVVDLTLETRSDDAAVLQEFPEQLLAEVAPALQRMNLQVQMTPKTLSSPTDCSETVISAVRTACTEGGYPWQEMPSGAGHDAAYMARLGPMGMIFVPCRDGRSHCPEEWIAPGQLADGARVLLQTLRLLDSRLSPHH